MTTAPSHHLRTCLLADAAQLEECDGRLGATELRDLKAATLHILDAEGLFLDNRLASAWDAITLQDLNTLDEWAPCCHDWAVELLRLLERKMQGRRHPTPEEEVGISDSDFFDFTGGSR